MVTQPFIVRPPSGPFPAQANLPNIKKYANASAQGISISSVDLDADINNCIDGINGLSSTISNLIVGVLPGANSPGNTFRFPITDGNSNISWAQVNGNYIAVNGLPVARLDQQAQGSMITWDQNQQPLVIAPGNPGEILQMIGIVGNAYPSFVAGAFLPLSGGTMQPNAFLGLPTAFSASVDTADGFLNGTGDGASYGLYNVQMKMTHGLGFTNTDSDAATGYLDFVLGKMSMAAGYWMKNAGGTDTEGAVLPATSAEMQTATATNRSVTPANISSSPYAAKGILLFTASSAAILNSKGGSWGVVRNAQGLYTITMPWTFNSANNYIVFVTPESGSTGSTEAAFIATKTTSTFQIAAYNLTGPNLIDPVTISVAVFAFSTP